MKLKILRVILFKHSFSSSYPVLKEASGKIGSRQMYTDRLRWKYLKDAYIGLQQASPEQNNLQNLCKKNSNQTISDRLYTHFSTPNETIISMDYFLLCKSEYFSCRF